MRTSAQLVEALSGKHLLKHPFYQSWSAGLLTKEDLKTYAKQYFHHVDAFPRYISATHSNCDDISARQVLLDNLVDEEKGDENHPELWMRFAEGLGCDREDVRSAELLPETKNLIDTFFSLSESSYAEGLGALFAYEHQVPEVAQTKIEGLDKFYGISDARTIHFFTEHLEADVWHREETSKLLEKLSPEDREKAEQAAKKLSEALWKFLDGVQRETNCALC